LLLRLVAPRVKDLQTRYIVTKSSSTLLLVMTLVFFVRLWFTNFSGLATFLTMISVGLTIVLKEAILSFFASIIIFWRSPFRLRDRIQVGDRTGDVVDMGLFYFTLLEVGNWVQADQATGRILKIPNAMVLTEPVANFSRGLGSIWNEIRLDLNGGADWRSAKAVLMQTGTKHSLQAIEEAKEAMQNAEGEIIFTRLTPTVYTRFDHSGIELTLRYLCTPKKRRDSEHAIFEELLEAYETRPELGFYLDKKKT